MKIIGIDIGNTAIKIALINLSGLKIEKKISLKTEKKTDHQIYSKKIEKLIQNDILEDKKIDIRAVIEVFLISVVPEINKIVIKAFKKVMNLETIVFHPKMIGMDTNKKCGHDNVILGLGAMQRSDSYIVVSFGTANVFITVVNKEPKGIIISPGLELSKQSLVEKTSLIKDFDGYEYNGIFNFGTSHAVSAGLILGQVGLVEKVINETQKQLKKDISIFFTGGNFMYIKDKIHLDYQYEYLPDLLFEGLIFAYKIIKKAL